MTVPSAISTVLLLTTFALPAFADDINCQSEFGDVTLDDDIVIAAPCTLNGTEVEGNIELFAGGSLTAIGATIDGNIKARTADFIDLENTEVDGNIDLRDMVGDTSSIRNSTIDGKVVAKENRSRLEIRNNYIDNKLKIEETSGGVIIADNVIDGDLECKRNTPAPNGGNNQVSGKKEGQCRNLEGVESPEQPDNDGPTAEPDEPTSTTEDSDPPVLELNTGTGGGASLGPVLIAALFLLFAANSRRRIG